MRPLHTVDPFRKGYKPENRPLPPEEKRMRGYLDRQAVLSPRHSVLDIPPVDVGIIRDPERTWFEEWHKLYYTDEEMRELMKGPSVWEMLLKP